MIIRIHPVAIAEILIHGALCKYGLKEDGSGGGVNGMGVWVNGLGNRV
ncbi:MAG: hypothetical protein ACTHMC_13875 [Pseudobacter sp.]